MKKLLSAIMVFTLIMSTVATTSAVTFAGTTDSTQLTKAIAAVKKVIEIPETLSEFEYYYDEGTDNDSTIQLNWSDTEHTSNVSATVSDKGIITSYYSYGPEFEPKGLAKITKAQAEKIATGYLQKLIPSTTGNYKLENSLRNDYGQDYTFTYRLYINDIPCDFISASIGINKYAGKISNYNYNSDLKDLAITEYPSKDKVITKDEAKKIYLSELGPKLKYFADYNYSKKALKVFAAYETDGSNRSIDATTGKIIKLYDNYVIYRNARDKAAQKQDMVTGSEAAEIQYTEEELKEIQKTENLMDKNQADKIARNLISSIGSQKLTSSSLRKDWGPNQEYMWYLNYEKDFVTLDAKAGTLIGFNCGVDDNSKNDIGLEKAKTIADSFLDKVCTDKKQQLVWTNESTVENKYSDYNFEYTRQENGISFNDNSVYISVNKANGTVVSYSRTWYDKVTFPKLDGAIVKEKALNIADNLGNFGLIYKKNSDGKVSLVYDFQQEGTFIIDAFKGVRLDFRGELYNDSGAVEYTDIAGNWAEKTIKELKNNGYYLEGDKFAPKAVTKQIDFFKYLYSPEQNYYTNDEDFYKMLVDNHIITKEEINANANITRQEAAKYIARYLGIDKLAKESSVFKNMYTDKIDKSYLGYASAAYALGIMKGDSKGRFNGSNTLTHAETAVVIYNILNKNK
ncbi:MAG: S-layer homology domain-containing protein [Aminipila sp.]